MYHIYSWHRSRYTCTYLLIHYIFSSNTLGTEERIPMGMNLIKTLVNWLCFIHWYMPVDTTLVSNQQWLRPCTFIRSSSSFLHSAANLYQLQGPDRASVSFGEFGGYLKDRSIWMIYDPFYMLLRQYFFVFHFVHKMQRDLIQIGSPTRKTNNTFRSFLEDKLLHNFSYQTIR